jgi:hypothetical protein
MSSLQFETAPSLTHADGRGHDHPHADGHDHDHGHSHDGPVEAGEAPKGGPVVLDIGGDIGALIAYCDADQIGTEIHVRLNGEPRTTHTGVWERDLGASRVVVAVFPELTFGDYAILDRGGDPVQRITVVGGSVVEVDLRRS